MEMLQNFFTANGDALIYYLKMVVEIAILTVVIYKLLYFLRGSRGAAVLAGMIILLLLLSLLSEKFKLDVISWLLSGLWSILGVALVIIFQPELRRAFAQVGSINLFQGKRRREVISELSAAAQDMSRRKCGALIVLERRIGLQNLVDDAEKVDMKVNAMVLESIFYPNSPLHDGAAVIRDGRIVAVRAIMPLTRSTDISVRLGTRHRAALGISEETDAVALVVSEESGAISIACRGVLHRDLSAGELEDYLEKLVVLKQDDLTGEDELAALINSGDGMIDPAAEERQSK